MTTKSKTIFAAFACILLAAAALEASATKVYFYEAKTQGNYKIAADYSAFKDKLKEAGYEVSDMRTEMTSTALRTLQADVLVIPNLAQDLTDAEKRAVFEFIAEDGKGVFICGATPAINKFTIPLGIMLVEDTLEDEDNKIRDIAGTLVPEKTSFKVTPPITRTDVATRTLLEGISGDLNVFGASGIYIFGKANGLLYAGDSANSPKSLLFPRGSNPPVGAYVRLGNGSLFVLSDPDMMANKYVDQSKYRNYNLKLGVNIVDWLSESYPDSTGLELQEVDDQLKAYAVEQDRLNRSIGDLQESLDKANAEKMALVTQLADSRKEVDELSKDKFMNITYSTWAMLLLAAGFFLTVAFMLRNRREAKKKAKGELGYEFKEAAEAEEEGSDEFSEEAGGGAEGNVKEEDIEERLKELEKKK